MKIPPCSICGISLKFTSKARRIAGRVLISQKGKRNNPKGYCFSCAPDAPEYVK
jgi:hypothetical protein